MDELYKGFMKLIAIASLMIETEKLDEYIIKSYFTLGTWNALKIYD